MGRAAAQTATLLILASALTAPSGASAQDPAARNLALLDELNPAPNVRYGDVWGAGDLILLATFTAAEAPKNGLYVVDAANPGALRLLSYLPTTDPPRDVTAADTLCLLAFEPGFPDPPRPAIALASIADPESPRILGTFRSDSVSQVHNAWLAPPYAYLACSSTGDLRVLDVSDPSSPREVASWSTNTPGRYLHDVFVVDTLAYLSYWEEGLRVLSVADPTRPFEVGRFDYPGAFTHSTVVSEDGSTAFLSDEVYTPPYGHVHVLDISRPSEIREIGSWTCPDADASVHNLALRDKRLYLAYYTCGVRILDVSSPATPIEMAFADVDTVTTRLSGFWGVFPTGPTGDLVYASHMDRGAFAFEVHEFRVLTVAAGGAGEFETIGAALDAASGGDTVRVAAGVYPERVTMRSGVVLEGAGAESTVIDAGGEGRAITLVEGRAGTRIARLGVTGGSAAERSGGAGILLALSSAIVESVAVYGNVAEGPGGGILIAGGEVEISHARVFGNRARNGGGIAITSAGGDAVGSVQLADCEIVENEASDAGGGLFVDGPVGVEIVRTRLARNAAARGGGAAALDAPFVALINSLVAWDSASAAGGGLYGEASEFLIENCVIADNAAPDASALGGGGPQGVFATLRGTVVSGNRGGATLSASSPSSFALDFCDVSGNDEPLVAGSIETPDPTRGNIAADAGFLAPSADTLDYLPRAGSPLFDAGSLDPAGADLDQTRQDIGLGGGPRSGWLAPRLPEGIAVSASDNFNITITVPFTEAEEPRLSIFRAETSVVPLDAEHLVARLPAFLDGCDPRSYCLWADRALGPSDTLVAYRIVPEDATGHAGSPGPTLAVRPTNFPPVPRVRLEFGVPRRSPNDSVHVRIDGNEPMTSLTLTVNGLPTEVRRLGRSYWIAEAPIPLVVGPLAIVAAATDTFDLAGIDSLVGDLAHLVPGAQLSGGAASGDFRFTAPNLDRESLFLVHSSAADSLPEGQIALTNAFSIEPFSSLGGVDVLDIEIRGPSVVSADEAIVVFQSEPLAFPARADPVTRIRTARVAIRGSLWSLKPPRIVLVARGAGVSTPAAMRLLPVSPNPFSGSTRVRLDLDRSAAEVSVDVYDPSGRRVRSLFRDALPRGLFSFEWDGTNDAGDPAPSGHYVVRGVAGGEVRSRHLVLIR